MPYYDNPYMISVEDLKMHVDLLLNIVDGIIQFRIIGGEPFLYKELNELLLMVSSCKKIYSIGIPTNGTILIRDHQLLKSLCERKVIVDISDYGLRDIKKHVEVLKKSHIRYVYTKERNWFDMGKPVPHGRTDNELDNQFSRCEFICRSILNGRIYICPRSAHGTDLGLIPSSKDDWFELKTGTKEELFGFYYGKSHILACDYCCMGTDNCNLIRAGEQVE